MLLRNLTLALYWWCNPLRTIASSFQSLVVVNLGHHSIIELCLGNTGFKRKSVFQKRFLVTASVFNYLHY